MNTNNESSLELCRILLRRAAWRLQYKARSQQYKESFCVFEYQDYNTSSFDTEILSKIYVKQLLDTIPWQKSKIVLERLILEEKTEQEIALELQISQQAVSKWKIKGLNVLRQNLKHLQI